MGLIAPVPAGARTALLFVSLGAVAVVGQVLLLREALVTVGGGEWALAAALAGWLLGGGLGSGAAVRLRPCSPGVLVAMAALAPTAGLLLSRSARWLLQVSPGQEWEPAQALLASCLPSALVAFALGASFAACCRELEPAGTAAYVAECVGSLVAGAALSFVLLGRLAPVLITLGAALLPALALACRGERSMRRAGYGLLVLLLVCLGIGVPQRLEEATAGSAARGLPVQAVSETPYGRLAEVRVADQRTLYLSGTPVHTWPVPVEATLVFHAVLAQHPAPRRVLLMGAPSGPLLEALLEHPIERLDVVEPDLAYLSAVGELPRDSRVVLHHRDGREFMTRSGTRWDVILLPLPGPVSLRSNRYYTAEFHRLARACLAPDGVLAFSTQPAGAYLDEANRALQELLLQTLSATFPEVSILELGTVWMLASPETQLVTDPALLAHRLGERGVQPGGLPPEILEGVLDRERSQDLLEQLSEQPRGLENRDERPLAVLLHAGTWSGWGSACVLPVLLVLPFLGWVSTRSGRAAPLGAAAAGGFATMITELVLLYRFQISHGGLYQSLGILVALFMAGLALGAAAAGRFRQPATLLRASLLGLGAVTVTASLVPAGELSPGALLLIAGVLAGAQFPAARGLLGGCQAPGKIYGAELCGAAVGAAAGGACLIPFLGTLSACLLAAACCTLAVLRLRGR